ncbi:MAG: hypothetical protein CMF69_04670 [Magnetovibrio sp.]|nr:hypothetical protein [Magnetovibrio sp.]|tara:strand:+ start:132 stop:644 length:513 start_codon:yes stop_codon:yes gene_type:complete
MKKTPGALVIGDNPSIYCDHCKKEAKIPTNVDPVKYISDGWWKLDNIEKFASKEAKQWGARAIQLGLKYNHGSFTVDNWLKLCNESYDGILTRPFITSNPSELSILRDFLTTDDETILDNIKDSIFIGSGDFCPDCIKIILKEFPELFEKTDCGHFRPLAKHSKTQPILT